MQLKDVILKDAKFFTEWHKNKNNLNLKKNAICQLFFFIKGFPRFDPDINMSICI